MRRLFSTVLGLAVLGVASWAWAMPAPKGVDELDALADIVVDAVVISIECVGVVEVPGELKQAKFRSTHDVTQTHAGEAPDRFHIDFFVDLMEVPPMSCAWREPSHWVGESAKLWLNKVNEDGEVYAMFDWSGIQYLDANAAMAPTDEEMALCTAEPDPIGGTDPDPPTDPDPGTDPNTFSSDDDTEGGCSMSSRGSTGSGLLMALALMGLMATRLRRSLSA